MKKNLYPSVNGVPWLNFKIYNRTTKKDLELGFFTCTFVLINEIKSTTNNKIDSKSKVFFIFEIYLINTLKRRI